ncbi:MAG TPA: PAS domain S-box protein [Candidatus Acidoferrales bacterium]|nr:PAS domain S-box protein [Candidatus Acidoferrales bacterium]
MRRKPTARSSRRRLNRIPRAARSLPSGEKRFRSFLDDMPVGVLMLGPRTEIQFANEAALEMWGVTAGQVLGKTGPEAGLIAVEQDGTEIPAAMRPGPRVATSGQAIRNEVMGFRRPGSQEILWVYGSAVPYFASDGSLRRIIATMTDVTPRKHAEAALERANELNRHILLSVQEGIVVHGRDLRYELWNPFMERMTGLASRDVLGKHPLELLPFLGETGAYALIEKALHGEISSSLDIPYSVPETGQAGWCDGDFAPLRNEKGEIAGAIVTVRNVTERKRREDELHQLSSRLLQLQDEERRRIARDLHDSFAQSLLAVNLNLAHLSRSGGKLNQQGRQVLADAHKIMKGLAREIRSLSYLLHPPALDELGLTSAIEEYASGFSRRSGIQANVEISPGIGRLPQETEIALFRIIQESLGNIQRHSGSASAKIQLNADRSSLRLEVSDRGRGFSSEHLKDQPAVPGTLGVGVFGMRERMRQLGGRLEISSGSSGTTVTAVLPLREDVQNARSYSHSG